MNTFFFLNNIEIAFIVSLFLLFVVQVYYYCFFYNKPLSYLKKRSIDDNVSADDLPSVSVIIVAKDSFYHLEQSLPVVLNQKYPNYEVIVVNIGFTEETDTLIKSLKLQYKNLYETFLPHEPLEENTDRKKIAYTIGIKAAKNEVLLFTEADAIPCTDTWIQSMMENMTDDKDIVVGYCRYNRYNTFYNRLARFDNLLYSLQYFSSTIAKKPYTGTLRNLAYRKELFFDAKGFSSVLNYRHSESIFLNGIMNSNNVAVSLNEGSFVSTDIDQPIKWRGIKIYAARVKRHFSKFRFASKQFSIETISRYLFYIVFAALTTYSIIAQNWFLLSLASLIFVAKLSIQLRVIHKAAQHFQAGEFHFSFILMEIVQPIYNLYFRTLARSKR